jgi:hypothetical protein
MQMSGKNLLLILAALAAAAFLLVQSLNILAGQNREQVHQELQKLLGKDATFDGLEVSLFTGLGFSAKDFRIADNPRFAATPLVRAKELRLGVSLTQLLFGKIVINSLTFQDPELQIITDEDGFLNLTAFAIRKKEPGFLPRLRTAPNERNHAVNFMITKLRLRNGRVDFIDRSVKEPAELPVRNVELDLKGLDPTASTRVRFTAAITEGLSHDVRIEGRLGPLSQDLDWLHQPVDLEMQFDSLQVPLLTRALPFLRNKIPRELDVAGPLALQAKVAGTFERPRITDIMLKGLLFGSSDYNATLTGQMEFSKSRDWAEAELKGKFTLDPVNLTDLRRLPFLQPLFPATLMTQGPISIHSRFEGSWESLRIGALITADKSEIRYGDWLRKPGGMAAELRGGISRRTNGFVLHDSTLTTGRASMTLSGVFKETPEPWLQIRLRTDPGPLAAWGRLLSRESLYGVRGTVLCDIVFDGRYPVIDARWTVQGKLKLTNSEFRDKQSGKKVDQLNADVSFLGRQARVDNASFRLGSSPIKVTAAVADLEQQTMTYELRSPELNSADLPVLPANLPNRIKNATFAGEAQVRDGAPLVNGSLSSSEGNLDAIAYRDLRVNLAWSPKGIRFDNLFLRALNGTLHSDGFWVADGDRARHFELTSVIESVDVRGLLTYKWPQLKDRIDGRLNFRGRFNRMPHNGATVQPAFKGSGETVIHGGTIRDFNLIAMLLPRIGFVPASNVTSRLPAILTDLINRQHTPFEVLKVNFTLDQQRLRTDNLLLITPDYTITGAGWVGLDRTTKWNGLFVLSPRLTQEIQREHKTVRHLLDRRGRLAVSFRVEGTLPNVRIRPENRALAQALGGRPTQKASEPGASVEEEQEQKERKPWLPKSLEQLMNR